MAIAHAYTCGNFSLIGGAGPYDGIFCTGIVALLLT
jgi:uncharacterized membrane protein